MPRAFALILLAVLLAVGAFAACFFTAARVRHAAANTGHELDWLRAEFRLSDAELARVRQLHEGYLPKCEEMCQRIAAKNGELAQLLAGSTNVSPAITQKLAEAAALRAECQARMLAHFYEVSHAMPPEPGRRYLAEMKRLTLGLHERQEAAMTRTNAPAHVQP